MTGWGTPAAPLLPATLRAALAGQPIDGWISLELGVEPGAEFAALGLQPWSAGIIWSPRIENYLVAVLKKAFPLVSERRAMLRPFPPGVEPQTVPWRNRTRNALARGNLLHDPHRLSECTYGQLLDLPGMGYVSVLDFAATSDPFLEEPAPETVTELREMTEHVVDQWWADQVTGDDPRFADLLPAKQTAAQQVDLVELTATAAVALSPEGPRHQLPALEQRVTELVDESLDGALLGYMRALLPHLDDRQVGALAARMGWTGEPPVTLEAAGRLMGTTRERARQLQARLYKRRPSLPVFMPSLDRALEELGAAAPLTVGQAADALREKGISGIPFHPKSVLSAAEYCGRQPTFDIREVDGTELIVSSTQGQSAPRLAHIALRQAGRYGISNLDEVLAQAASEDIEASREETRTFLKASPRFQFLDDDWFWSPAVPIERNRLHNTTRGILSVISPMDIASLREGIRRRYRWRRLHLVAPRAILLKFYEVHPDFVVDGDQVSSKTPLDYRKELGASEQAMVDVLRTVPAGILDRASFLDACLQRGINANTFSVLTTYSSVISHPETDAWSIRGARIDPMALKALLDANARRPRERRMLAYGWSPDGNLWIAYRIASPNGIVVGIPRPIGPYLSGREFAAIAEDGSSVGTVVISDELSSWGYAPFLTRRGGDDGDVLVVTFDLLANTAQLRLDAPDVLDDEADALTEPLAKLA